MTRNYTKVGTYTSTRLEKQVIETPVRNLHTLQIVVYKGGGVKWTSHYTTTNRRKVDYNRVN